MKKLILHLLAILILVFISACSSIGNVTIDNVVKDKSFIPSVFFKSNVHIYDPFLVIYDDDLFHDVKYKEFNESLLKIIGDEIQNASDSVNVIPAMKMADEMFFGAEAYKSHPEDLLRNEESDFIIIIQVVAIGINIRNYEVYVSKLHPVPYTKFPPPADDNSYDEKLRKIKETIETTMYFDIWDVKQKKCVLSVDVNGEYAQRFYDFDQFSVIKKVTEAFVDYLENPYKK